MDCTDLGVRYLVSGQPLICLSEKRKRLPAGHYVFAGDMYRFSSQEDGTVIIDVVVNGEMRIEKLECKRKAKKLQWFAIKA